MGSCLVEDKRERRNGLRCNGRIKYKLNRDYLWWKWCYNVITWPIVTLTETHTYFDPSWLWLKHTHIHTYIHTYIHDPSWLWLKHTHILWPILTIVETHLHTYIHDPSWLWLKHTYIHIVMNIYPVRFLGLETKPNYFKFMKPFKPNFLELNRVNQNVYGKFRTKPNQTSLS